MKELYQKVAADAALQEEVAKILAGAEEKGAEATEDALLAFAKEQGFTVTMDEVKAFFEGMQTVGELSEEEMDQVAGGKVSDSVIILSIISFGVVCGALSLSATTAAHCANYLESL